MSRNPYLAASRPSSSFTRSSRTSKRNDLSSSKGSLLGRSRSSAALGGLTSSNYTSSTSYTPSSALSWQRSTSSNRLNRQGSDLSSSNTNYSSYKSSDYSPSNNNITKPSLYKSISTNDLNYNDSQKDEKDIKDENANVLFFKPISYHKKERSHFMKTFKLTNFL